MTGFISNKKQDANTKQPSLVDLVVCLVMAKLFRCYKSVRLPNIGAKNELFHQRYFLKYSNAYALYTCIVFLSIPECFSTTKHLL